MTLILVLGEACLEQNKDHMTVTLKVLRVKQILTLNIITRN